MPAALSRGVRNWSCYGVLICVRLKCDSGFGALAHGLEQIMYRSLCVGRSTLGRTRAQRSNVLIAVNANNEHVESSVHASEVWLFI